MLKVVVLHPFPPVLVPIRSRCLVSVVSVDLAFVMDPHRIVEALQATLGALEAGQREGAEKLLLEVYFTVSLSVLDA